MYICTCIIHVITNYTYIRTYMWLEYKINIGELLSKCLLEGLKLYKILHVLTIRVCVCALILCINVKKLLFNKVRIYVHVHHPSCTHQIIPLHTCTCSTIIIP